MDWKIWTAGSAVFGPFIKASNGTGFVTGIGAAPTAYVIKGDRSFVTFSPATWRHVSGGMFIGSLTAGLHNKYGHAKVFFAKPATYLEVWEDFNVKSRTAYNIAYSSGAVFDTATLSQFGEVVLAMAKGKYKASGSNYIMYMQDNTTKAVEFALTATGRNRV